tara:strand:- start:687 stop:851 length:165 start_codon:yes stop_codon:yes gene_type:complete
MRDTIDNMYKVQFSDGHSSSFPRSHDGLEKAIITASQDGLNVTFKDEVIWPPED